MVDNNQEVRTIPLIAQNFIPQAFKKYGQLLQLDGHAIELTDDEHPYYQIQVIELEPKGEYLNELTCTYNSLTILMPLEKVPYILTLGPAIDKYRTRPFPGTNEIVAFYSEGDEGFMLNAGIWFSLPFVETKSKWLEIVKFAGGNAKIAEQETRNDREILKVCFQIEPPHTDDSPRLL